MNATFGTPTGGGQRGPMRASAAIAAIVVSAATLAGCGGSKATVRTTPSSVVTSTTTTSPPATSPGSSTPAKRPSTTTPSGPSFAYQALFPFASVADARAWQQDTGGHQPWHGDPEQTALAFVGYLGYSGIDKVTSHTGGAADAEVGVGYATEGGRTSTAAVVHLVRFGDGAGAPWEVVGTADTTLTLTEPGYGSTVSSPVGVGGRISGVDESIRTQVRQLSSSAPLGESCCLPAGGDRSPWHTTVSFTGATDRVLTISVATGGHIQAVERFAVTGVRTS